MDKLELAQRLIRPTLASKLTDRAWLVPSVFCAVAWVAAFAGKVEFDAVMQLTGLLIGGATLGEKFKDAVIGGAAVRGEAPQSVAVGSVGDAATSGEAMKEATAQAVSEIARATGATSGGVDFP